MSEPLVWCLITLICIGIQGFFSMVEMAAVSFNRIRLEYYVRKNIKRAIWIQTFLQKPVRLFGTVMLGVNIALQVGSQSARELYRALGIDPDLAPLTQVLIVVIFGELVPLFAARRFPEHVAMLGIPLVYGVSKLLSPLIWAIGLMTHAVQKIFKQKGNALDLLITREELQQAIESHEEEDDFNVVVKNIFSLKNKSAAQVMTPLSEVQVFSSHMKVGALRKKLSSQENSFIPLYHQKRQNIVGIAITRNLIALDEESPVQKCAQSPWFITAGTKLTPILIQFRVNQQSVAVVLSESGDAIGILSLDSILKEIFGEYSPTKPLRQKMKLPLIERAFPGNTQIADFNREFGTDLPTQGVETLSQLVVTLLDHPPETGDAVVINQYELIVEEAALLGIKRVIVKTLET